MGAVSRWFERYGCDVVADGLVVGAIPRDADDVRALEALGVGRVVSLVADAEYEEGQREAVTAAYAAARIEETRVPSADFGSLSAATLEAASDAVLAAHREGRGVYLHCRAGWQRSVVSAAATLARSTGDGPAAALAVVLERRPDACPLPHQVDDLHRWWAGRDGD